MRNFISSIVLMLVAAISNAQTTATNWTAPDCNSVSHTLFDELDAGKVIVFTWVMPCSFCKNGAKAAYNAVQSFATSHPGVVLSYLADDLGDETCTSLQSWITANSIGSLSNMTVFSNAGTLIDETNFGGSGMPHVVVMAGTDHKIYYNKRNSASDDLTGITAAINEALGIPTGTTTIPGKAKFTMSPNPVTDNIHISCTNKISRVTITTVMGQVVSNEILQSTKDKFSISLSGATAGIYLVSVVDANGNTAVQKFVKL
jgi:hypothetical protein